jgi:hypothetical protein
VTDVGQTVTATGIGANSRSAEAKVDRGDELETSREQRVPSDAGDRDNAVLQRLPERLENGARGLRQLVEKADAVVPQGAGMSLEDARLGSPLRERLCRGGHKSRGAVI